MSARRDSREVAAAPQADCHGWDRDQLSVRLTPARRERLRQLASALASDATPGDAIDLALARALENPDGQAPTPCTASVELLARLGSIESTIAEAADRSAATAARALDRAEDAVARASAAQELLVEISRAGTEAAGDAQPTYEPPTLLRDWLDALPNRPGVVEVVGRWHSKTRLGAGHVALDLEIADRRPETVRTVTRLAPISTSCGLSTADAHDGLSLSCARSSGGGWTVLATALRRDGTPGAVLGSASV
jgi:hypothetical protein